MSAACARAVSMITGTSAVTASARTLRQVSYPSITGIIRSRATRSARTGPGHVLASYRDDPVHQRSPGGRIVQLHGRARVGDM